MKKIANVIKNFTAQLNTYMYIILSESVNLVPAQKSVIYSMCIMLQNTEDTLRTEGKCKKKNHLTMENLPSILLKKNIPNLRNERTL